MSNPTQTDSPTTYAERVTASAKYHWAYPSADGTRMIPVLCDRPLDEAATDVLRSAMRACKPVPSVLGNRARRRIPAAPVPRT